MRLKGEGDYFTGILLFLLFSGLLEMSEKVSVCLATHFLSFFSFFFLHRFKLAAPGWIHPGGSALAQRR